MGHLGRKAMKIRWLIPRLKKHYDYNHGMEKWSNTLEKEAERILQYSLDGKTWEDVECKYFDVPEEDIHKYKWK